MDDERVRILIQYVNALSEASEQLEKAYIDKNMVNFFKIKKFILEVKSKIDILLQ